MTLQVTDQASAHLKTLLENTEHEGDQVIRLAADEQGNMTLLLDVERTGDQIVEHQGEKVMVIEAPVSEGLNGAALDLKETPMGQSLTITKEPPA